MRIIKVEDFLNEIKSEWDDVDMSWFNYKNRNLVHYWVNIESLQYDKETERIYFKDWKNNLLHNVPVTEQILVEKKQIWNGEVTEYIMNLNDDEDITFEATKIS